MSDTYMIGMTVVELVAVCLGPKFNPTVSDFGHFQWSGPNDYRVVLKRTREGANYVLTAPALPPAGDPARTRDLLNRWFALQGIASEFDLEWDSEPYPDDDDDDGEDEDED